MNVLTLLKAKAKQLVSTAISDILAEHPGRDLKRMLGLEKFKYAYIQKILNYSKFVFVVTVDSKYPNIRISPSTLDKADFSFPIVVDIKYRQLTPKFVKLSPPLLLDDFMGMIPSDTLILFRDFAGEYQLEELMYENTIEVKNITKLEEKIK